ncbi:MAG: hypothetical protein ABJA37_02020 [Ferruginibacter sp.]
MIKPILVALSVILLVPNFIDKNINDHTAYNLKEKFVPSLSYINSIDKLEAHTDSLAATKNIPQQTADYYTLLESIVSDRFYHGFSQYTLKENWVAAVSQRVIGYGLDNKVLPADIMKNEMAACSQQTAVMMAIAKKKKTNYRSVGFPHHYAMEVEEKGYWYFLDANMEPSISTNQRRLRNWRAQNDSLKKYYNAHIYSTLNYQFGVNQKASFGALNGNPAPRLKLFHIVTLLLSKLLWCIPLILLFVKIKSKAGFKKSPKPGFNAANDLHPLLSV